MSVEDLASGVKLAYWDLNKAAYLVTKQGYQKAQELAMRFQNYKHKGGSGSDSTTPATTSGGSNKNQWKSDEQYQSTTYWNTTTYRKREK